MRRAAQDIQVDRPTSKGLWQSGLLSKVRKKKGCRAKASAPDALMCGLREADMARIDALQGVLSAGNGNPDGSLQWVRH
jgi:hypothetical protein